MTTHRLALAPAAALFAVVLATAGCSYYAINEPTSDRTYYTTEYKQLKGGALTFTDAATGKEITIQNAEIEKIDETQYKAATAGSE
ncbi:MAG: hypothetical protein AAFY08_08660 [Planctomycetota bacterium]